jgi:hypothetical protein
MHDTPHVHHIGGGRPLLREGERMKVLMKLMALGLLFSCSALLSGPAKAQDGYSPYNEKLEKIYQENGGKFPENIKEQITVNDETDPIKHAHVVTLAEELDKTQVKQSRILYGLVGLGAATAVAFAGVSYYFYKKQQAARNQIDNLKAALLSIAKQTGSAVPVGILVNEDDTLID